MTRSDRQGIFFLLFFLLAGVFWFWFRIFSGGALRVPTFTDFALYILLVPVAEELFFRGVLQDYFKSCTGKSLLGLTFANIIVSVLFAAAHIPFWGVMHAGLVYFPSLAFGFLYDKTGKLVYPILLHAIYNFNIFIV